MLFRLNKESKEEKEEKEEKLRRKEKPMGLDLSRDIGMPLLLVFTVLFVSLLVGHHWSTGNLSPGRSLLEATGITFLQIFVFIIYARKVDRDQQAQSNEDLRQLGT